ncbi:hypothetical protein Taro_035456 [Colocasia esculenta]|uniref:Polysaccharide biosynthesis domain-containing protein n=1 Tax=Colocasia esculenta TaxID=4460 RepID=A0A843W3V1_COLES|nr:hypothetical protein [Colocasia esculenta]
MRSKVQSHVNLKHAVLGLFLLFLLVLLLRSTFSSTPPQSTSTKAAEPSQPVPSPSCDKIPPSMAQAIVHYATSNNTPQQTLKEISVTARVLERRSPCNFLVFGLGHDSLMWAALNHGGRTVFLEEDAAWIKTIRQKLPSLEAYHVAYNTRVRQADELLEYSKGAECTSAGGDDHRSSGCPLALRELPAAVLETEWDLIMVDAPTGYFEEAPGRMGAIYTAGMMARGRREGETDVFVHDVNRPVEDRFSKAFLCEGYLAEQEGILRHFTIPSHRAEPGRPFCPAV